MISKHSIKTLLTACIITLAPCEVAAQDSASSAPQETAEASKIEVAFVLDTTGSMGGLIEGAKQKVWSIANQIVSAKPTPELKIGLVGYRDRRDDYVTKVFDLSEDIDAVYGNLKGFAAGGGGDGPESVNQALHEAVTKLSWSDDRDVLKIVFLVGDAPPHMDYANDVKYQQICQNGVKKDLIINTVQCGGDPATRTVWQEISRLGEGSYVAIDQSGGMQAVTTPYDKRLAELNTALGRTVVTYGSRERRSATAGKLAEAEAMPVEAAADRMAFASKSKSVVFDGGDLLGAMAEGKVSLNELDQEELPEELRDKNEKQQQSYLEEKRTERAGLQKEITQLAKQRQDYIDAENLKLAKAGKGDSFDGKVFDILKEQAARKRITYDR